MANAKRVLTLRRTLSSIQPDRIVSFCDQMNIVTLQAARRMTAPVIISEHSNPAKQQLGSVWESWRSRNYPKCTRCVVLTDEIASYMERWVEKSRICVIPAAISPPIDVTPLKRSENIVLAVGRLSREKGFDLLIDAWRRIQHQLPGWQLQIAGDGIERDSLKAQTSDLPSVKLLGWIPNAWPLYQQATLFVLPSRYEGFPVALVEAISQGCPAIATRCTEATQTAPLSTALELVEIESAAQIAAAILKFSNNSDLRMRLAAAGVQAAAEFHWQNIGVLWINSYATKRTLLHIALHQPAAIEMQSLCVLRAFACYISSIVIDLLFAKPISDTANGFDHIGQVAKFSADRANVNVDRSFKNQRIFAERIFDQLATIKGSPGL